MEILIAQEKDLKEILALQYAAFESEAIALNDPAIQPMTETLEELQEEFKRGKVLKAVQDGKIIGTVRTEEDGNKVYINKLAVDPSFQGHGLGKKLVAAAEGMYCGKTFYIHTNAHNPRNVHLYLSSGYTIVDTKQETQTLTFVYFEKKQ